MAQRPRLSIVIPVYNEEANLEPLYRALHDSLASCRYPWEAILVDDGSTDRSPEILRALAARDPERIRVIFLRRNFGQTAAIAAGIDHAQGDIIVLMDADLQNDPADIPKLLAKMEEGYDVVSGWRKDRQDPFFTRVLPSRFANALISWVTGVHLHDYGCTLKAYRREVLQGFRLYGEMHRFIPAYAAAVGARITEIPVRHHPRLRGKSKYGLNRTIKVILDLFTVKFLLSYFHKPIYLFGGLGLLLTFLGTAVLIFLFIRRVFWQIGVTTSPFFQTAIMFIILGFQSILMGLIAELLVRTYHEAQNKPTYTVRETLNLPRSRSQGGTDAPRPSAGPDS